MTPKEAAALLTVASAYDNRKPDADAAQAWALALDGLPFTDCRDAIVAHYRASSDWLMPDKVITAVRRIRNKRIAEAGDLCPPSGMTEAEERAWVGRERQRIGDGLPPSTVDHGELKERHLPDLRHLLPSPTTTQETP